MLLARIAVRLGFGLLSALLARVSVTLWLGLAWFPPRATLQFGCLIGFQFALC
jgi:hypothetical protein